MPKIYALLVGIDDYSQSNAVNLHGAVNDIDFYESFLTETYKDKIALEKLTNGQATQAEVIRLFREHLGQAKEHKDGQDVALFIFAGHGKRTKSADAFKPFFPDGLDEGLVCADSLSPTNEHTLTDKEITLLTLELEQNNPHIAFILDCCHSGSATRNVDDDPNSITRSWEPLDRGSLRDRRKKRPRDIESYSLNSTIYNYKDKIDSGSFLLPMSRHISLAACTRLQLAHEVNGRGNFSSAMQHVLSQEKDFSQGASFSYADLFSRVRNYMLKWNTQDPQFQPYGGFNPFQQFLGSDVKRHTKSMVSYKKGEWYVDRGAFNNLPTDEKTVITVYEDEVELGTATTRRVLTDESILSLSSELHKKLDPIKADEERSRYDAIVSHIPNPEPVLLRGSAKGIESIKAAKQSIEDKGKGLSFEFIESNEQQSGNFRYEMVASDEDVKIHRLSDNTFIQGARKKEYFEILLETALENIIQWERSLGLQNTDAISTQDVSFWIEVDNTVYEIKSTDEHGDRLPSDCILETAKTDLSTSLGTYHPNNQITLSYTPPPNPKTPEEEAANDLRPRFFAKNNTNKNLHLILLHFNSEYKIESKSAEYLPKNTELIDLTPFYEFGNGQKEYLGWYSEEGITSLWYKLIVTDKNVDYHHILQPGFTKDKKNKGEQLLFGGFIDDAATRSGERRRRAPQQDIMDTWFTKTCEVRIIKKDLTTH
ncbi:MAG: caspase family protein [Rhodothermaceae bacterium]|nr:caspase family protein [Rhodothermaceae bacterium]